jgi:hypothetical protein
MDWIDVARAIAPIAPFAGSVLGGLIPFPGASAIGQGLGTLIAKSFGVDATPDAVHAAVTSSPNEMALARINAAMEEAKAQWPALADAEKAWAQAVAAGAAETNATMRVELQHEHWFFTGWRATAGWIFDAFMAPCGVLLLVAIYRVLKTSPAPLQDLTAAWPILLSYIGALAAMVGVIVNGRSLEKCAAIGAGTNPHAPTPTVVPAPAPPASSPPKTISPKPIITTKVGNVADRQAGGL